MTATCDGSTLPALLSSSQTVKSSTPTSKAPDCTSWMVRLWSPENPTRAKTSSGLLPNALRMKYSGIRRPEVDARDPKVNDLPAMSFGNSLVGCRPVLVLAMTNDLNATSSAPCAIASEPGTWRRACTPVKPPNQASWTWPLVNAVTAAG